LTRWANVSISSSNLDSIEEDAGPPDIVYHLAGASSVGLSFSLPTEDFQRSVLAAIELCEWLRLRHPETPVVMASSAAVYGAGHNEPIAEETPSTPYSPYGFHKRMAELAFESYARNFGIRTAMVRLFSVYGDELRKQLIWDACTKLRTQGGHLRLGGTGEELRDWLHISDTVRILELAGKLADSSGFLLNGGTGIATPVSRIAEMLCERWGGQASFEFSGESRKGDPTALVASTTRARTFSFEPATRLSDGLADYIDWFHRQSA
jgi:UDP-glucose 4-epimerase